MRSIAISNIENNNNNKNKTDIDIGEEKKISSNNKQCCWMHLFDHYSKWYVHTCFAYSRGLFFRRINSQNLPTSLSLYPLSYLSHSLSLTVQITKVFTFNMTTNPQCEGWTQNVDATSLTAHFELTHYENTIGAQCVLICFVLVYSVYSAYNPSRV